MRLPATTYGHILFVAALLLPLLSTAQEAKHVLFIGNSYTEANNLPQMVTDVAASMGDVVTSSCNTPGGCTFQGHCNNQSMTLIRQGGWDAVVLQEQSQYPSFPDSQVEAEVFPYARRLVDSIYAHGWCTEPMFYMTWGRRDGDSYNAQFFPPLATYEGMDSLLCERYRQMGEMNDASVCPVGRVWRYLRTYNSGIELYQSDGSHPSVAGTYAAACSFYTMLFHRDPLDITYHPDALPPAQAQTIRQAVNVVVYGSLPDWQRHQPALQVMEVDTPKYMACSFMLESEHCDTILCSWGDGTDTLFVGMPWLEARHTYADTGLYTITFTASRHCLETVETRSFHAIQEESNGIDDLHQNHNTPVAIYPNPATDRVMASVGTDMVLYTLDGRPLRRCHAAAMSLDGLSAGSYILTVDGVPYRLIKR